MLSKDLAMNIHENIIHSNPQTRDSPVSNDGGMDKQLVAYFSVKYFSAILMPAITLANLQMC